MSGGVRAPDAGPGLRRGLAVAVPAWLLSRALVLVALGATRYALDRIGPDPDRSFASLTAWDAAFYADIAGGGYDAVPTEGLRFFPLLPLLARLVDLLLPGGAEAAVVVVANVAALAFLALLHRLALRETGSAALARRAVWLGALAPAAFVLVMGYSEPLFAALAVATFLALRSRRFTLAAVPAFLAGLCRPVALLLSAPAAVEAARGIRSLPARDLPGRLLAVLAAPLGSLAYLLWARDRTGDLFRPLRFQEASHLRGEAVSPVEGLVEALRDALDAHRVGPALHVAWALVAVALLVVAFRRLPASYGLFATASILVALSSRNLDSFERYALGAFPLVIAAASLTGRDDVERGVLVLLGGGMTGYAMLAFFGVYVP